MVDWTDNQREIIEKFAPKGRRASIFFLEDIFEKLPNSIKKYKCKRCFTIVPHNPCPECNHDPLSKMCPLDSCKCPHEIIETVEYCPICGEAVCPKCGSHDVMQLSRVTGYMQDVGGWNVAKKQELKDRHRYNIQ